MFNLEYLIRTCSTGFVNKIQQFFSDLSNCNGGLCSTSAVFFSSWPERDLFAWSTFCGALWGNLRFVSFSFNSLSVLYLFNPGVPARKAHLKTIQGGFDVKRNSKKDVAGFSGSLKLYKIKFYLSRAKTSYVAVLLNFIWIIILYHKREISMLVLICFFLHPFQTSLS